MFNLYVDGGGTSQHPCYFSFKCIERPHIIMNRFYLSNLAPELLPYSCSTVDDRGLSSNNLAEYCALYYGLLAMKKSYNLEPLTIYHDSEVVVRQVLEQYNCTKPHLQQWLTAVRSLWWHSIVYTWVPRKDIIKILRH